MEYTHGVELGSERVVGGPLGGPLGRVVVVRGHRGIEHRSLHEKKGEAVSFICVAYLRAAFTAEIRFPEKFHFRRR